MGLKQLQQALAELYTSQKVRQAYVKDPNSLYEQWDFNAEDISQLEQTPHEQIEFFAKSLLRKRLGVIRDLLPLTTQLLNKNLETIFAEYAETYQPFGAKKHQLDAIRFVEYLHKSPQHTENLPVYWKDVLRYEACWVRVHLEPDSGYLAFFQYPVRTWAMQGKLPASNQVKKKWAVGSWLRWGSHHPLWFRWWSW